MSYNRTLTGVYKISDISYHHLSKIYIQRKSDIIPRLFIGMMNNLIDSIDDFPPGPSEVISILKRLLKVGITQEYFCIFIKQGL